MNDAESKTTQKDEEWATSRDIARELDIDYKTVCHWANHGKIRRKPAKKAGTYLYHREDAWIASNAHAPNQFNRLSAIDVPRFDDFLHVEGDNAIVASDAHVPFVDVDLFNGMLDFADRYSARTFLFIGDWNDEDSFGYFFHEQEPQTWEFEMAISDKCLEHLLQAFRHIKLCLGNHDKRLARLLQKGGKRISILYPFKKFLEHRKVEVTWHQKIIYRGNWHLEHPTNVQRVGGIPLTRRQATVEGHVCSAHGHMVGWQRSPSARWHMITLPMLADQGKIAYKALPNSWPNWNPGFLWLHGDIPIIIEKDSLDFWLRDMQLSDKKHGK